MNDKNTMALVIFDIGGVVVRCDADAQSRDLAKHSRVDAQTIMARMKSTHSDQLSLTGKDAEYFSTIRAIVENDQLSDDTIRRSRYEVIREVIPESLETKRALHDAGNTIGILSSMDSMGHTRCDALSTDILNTYGGPRSLSYEQGMAKPDVKVFEPFIGKDTLIIFIEDKAAYLKHPVERLGWIGIHLTGYRDYSDPLLSHAAHQDAKIDGKIYQAESWKDAKQILLHIGVRL
jgi:FMN phosphatase YigB (HAD superfamily)